MVQPPVRRWLDQTRLDRWRRAAVEAGRVWLVSHLGYLAMLLVSRRADAAWMTLTDAIGTWRQQDTNWYLVIAEHGYATGDVRETAFFPGYPVAIWMVDPIVPGDTFIASLTIANIALFGALAVLYRLVERELDPPAARRTLWYLMLFPTAFFLVAGYPTSLLLLFTVGSVYAMRTRRWWIAGMLGGLATATRQTAVVLIAVFAFEHLRQHRTFNRSALAITLIPSGLVAFMGYLWIVRGNPLVFSQVQQAWRREPAPPWWGLARAVAVFHRLPLVNNQNDAIELAAALMMAILLTFAVVGPWRLRRDQLGLPLLGWLLLAFFMSYPTVKPLQPLMSVSRFALEVFPAFVMLGRLGEHRTVDYAYTCAALGVQSALLVHFLHGGWVA
jgi:Mannosyltransferase (PIG-V)